jgi:excisionase family DNA binding protein
MTAHTDPSDPIRPCDDVAPTGGAPPTAGLPNFLTVVEAARLLRIGRTSAYQLAQQWCDTDGQKGLPVVRVGRQLRVPRRALEHLAGGELTAASGWSPESTAVPAPQASTSMRAPTNNDTPQTVSARTLNRALTRKPRADERDAHGTQPPLFPTDR